jgi:eukaryotic-like serine/threonine-protein kinase
MPELRDQLVRALADRYHIEREIGTGGMATVYLARDVKHERHVALKVLDPELAAVMGVERFLAEIRVTANLQHPNLLPLFDSGKTVDGSLFYVMPFVEGESLRQRLDREKQLPIDEAVRITTAIASAVDYAHRHHVVHRDLKPENVLLQDGQPLVADFGIALAITHAGGHRITQTGLSLGTPSYMSPEQATGDRAIDGRTDVYSLGAMMYEMLTGEPPHTGSTAQAIIARVLTEKPRAVRAVRPAVPANVEAAVDRALEKLPADRWATAGEFCDAINTKRRTQPIGMTRRSWRGRDLLAPVPLAMLLVTLGSLVLSALLWRALKQQEPVTTLRFQAAANLREVFTSSPGPSISPDGMVIAYVGLTPGGTSMVFVRRLDELTTRTIPGTEQGVQPVFSPDGEWIAFFASGALRKVHLASGSVRQLAPMNLPPSVEWGMPDTLLVSDGYTLLKVPASGGRVIPFTTRDTANGEVSQRGPRMLPNGKAVVFFSWRGSFEASKIGIVSLATGETKYLDLAGAPVGVVDDLMIYVNADEGLFAVPFDADRGRLTGQPVRLREQVPLVNGLPRAALSRTGTLVYSGGSWLAQLVLVDSKGNSEVVMKEPRYYSFPRFSPDGKRIAVSMGTTNTVDVWIYDIASGTPTRLTSEGVRSDRAEWSPDGKRVLYSNVDQHMTGVWWRNADLSGAPERLEGSADEQVLEGLLTPDGTTLIFRSTSANHLHDLWYRKLQGDTARKPIVNAPSFEYAPRLSPDGKWLAYTSSQDGPMQVYVQPFPPTGARYQVTDVGGTSPIWSPDGRHIFYFTGGKLHAASVRTTPGFSVLSHDVVMDVTSYNVFPPVHANYDVAPDGKHFLLVRPTDPSAGLVVVHGWKHELREAMRARR